MTNKTKKTAEDWSITLTKISISLLFIASTILIFLGPWIVNLIIVFPSPLVQGEVRFWILPAPSSYRAGPSFHSTKCSISPIFGLGSWNCCSYLTFHGTDSLSTYAPGDRFLQYFDLNYPCHSQCFWQGY